ncbi:MAG: FRG domain-containing protein [Sphingobacteriales bacterium]|nr:MAG: FRG domain-containing protein [Sphingobacteriales bacterium]
MNEQIKIVEVSNIPDYITAIESLSEGSDLWFRGVPSNTFTLTPSIYRNKFDSGDEKILQTKFKSRAIPFLKNRPVENYWEWLFLMQHFGLPTRLMDWSSSALIALGFAIIFRESHVSTHDAGVWCLKPIVLNKCTKIDIDPEGIIPDITADDAISKFYEIKSRYQADYPIAITGPLNNERITAQKGVFTLFPDKASFNLEDLSNAHDFLSIITIKNQYIEDIKGQLSSLGITETAIYPDLNNLALEIRNEYLKNKR